VLAVWDAVNGQGPTSTSEGLRARLLDSAGQPVGAVFRPTGGGGRRTAALSAGPGGWLLTWGGAPAQTPLARLLGRDGHPRGPTRVIDSGTAFGTAAAYDPASEEYLVTWGTDLGARARMVGLDGRPSGRVHPVGPPDAAAPRLAWGDGRFLLTGYVNHDYFHFGFADEIVASWLKRGGRGSIGADIAEPALGSQVSMEHALGYSRRERRFITAVSGSDHFPYPGRLNLQVYARTWPSRPPR
jgi:hypothetical protein